MKPIFIFVITSLILLSCNHKEQDKYVYILPKNYHGVVAMLYDSASGSPEYENGTRTYHIPENGILKTHLLPANGWSKADKFYYFDNGTQIEIPYEGAQGGVKACCFSGASSSFPANRSGDSVQTIKYVVFYVGLNGNNDSIQEWMKKFRPL